MGAGRRPEREGRGGRDIGPPVPRPCPPPAPAPHTHTLWWPCLRPPSAWSLPPGSVKLGVGEGEGRRRESKEDDDVKMGAEEERPCLCQLPFTRYEKARLLRSLPPSTMADFPGKQEVLFQ